MLGTPQSLLRLFAAAFGAQLEPLRDQPVIAAAVRGYRELDNGVKDNAIDVGSLYGENLISGVTTGFQ